MFGVKLALLDSLVEFQEEGRLFSVEIQFQFELAWKLKEKGFSILLEVLSKSQNEKMYTDIVIDLGNKKYVAIELKYKIKQKNNITGLSEFCYKTKSGNEIYMFGQGAYCLGCYRYLKDIERIEKLVTGELAFNFSKNNKVIGGFALMMSNDFYYWNQGNKSKKYTQFILSNHKEITGKLSSGIDKTYEVNLTGKYVCDWKEYSIKGIKNYGKKMYPAFKYLINEII